MPTMHGLESKVVHYATCLTCAGKERDTTPKAGDPVFWWRHQPHPALGLLCIRGDLYISCLGLATTVSLLRGISLRGTTVCWRRISVDLSLFVMGLEEARCCKGSCVVIARGRHQSKWVPRGEGIEER